MSKTIDTTAGQINAKLVVYRDFTTSGGGHWRLFWEDLARPGCGFNDQSTVTGQPFYKTMREAVSDGIRRHGMIAERATF